ncbi:methyltransferase domain-containing protein [Porifericola rhodea]|uniref:class I SAM-dependent methyltransferase n=1 Tax=Porifericola rhodea TaxID=930972 RepID=UPI0026667312|nr:class I SAM-dependent methyltransferase [Porifericola rhodea]WKN31813.1 methyltransferase domain-containing protein [Porifericola rhodea]
MKKMIRWAIRYVPRKYLQLFGQQLLNIIAFFYRGNNVQCPVDGKKYSKFLPYGRIETRSNALCPSSLTLERHRLMWLYLKNKTDFFTAQHKVLHVAPEICFIHRFEEMPNLDYTTADLESPWAKVKMDLHNVPFADNSFDVVFCNHVMEHVENDIQCMQELYRVLKPGGWAIIQSPVYNFAHTKEDPSITDPVEREKAFGQRDHVRMYGQDYGDRLRKAGFTVTEDDYVKQLPPEKVKWYALMDSEIIYFCQKTTAKQFDGNKEQAAETL